MLSDAAQQSLPQDAQVALQQVDNREYSHRIRFFFKRQVLATKRAPIAEYHDGLWLTGPRSQILFDFSTCGLDA